MSQVKCKSAKGDLVVDLQAGWDGPLQEFFLIVFRAEDDEVFWSSNEAPYPLVPSGNRADTLTTQHLRDKLHEFQIAVPPGFWEKVELRERNVVHEYEDEKWVTKTHR